MNFLTLREMLHRDDVMSVGLRGEQDARRHELAIKQDRTRSALARLAAMLHAPHTVAPQERHQYFIGFTFKLLGLTVEIELDEHND